MILAIHNPPTPHPAETFFIGAILFFLGTFLVGSYCHNIGKPWTIILFAAVACIVLIPVDPMLAFGGCYGSPFGIAIAWYSPDD